MASRIRDLQSRQLRRKSVVSELKHGERLPKDCLLSILIDLYTRMALEEKEDSFFSLMVAVFALAAVRDKCIAQEFGNVCKCLMQPGVLKNINFLKKCSGLGSVAFRFRAAFNPPAGPYLGFLKFFLASGQKNHEENIARAPNLLHVSQGQGIILILS